MKNLNLTFSLFSVIMLLNLSKHLGDTMKLENTIISKVPRPSRAFQMGILHHIECRFQELAQTSCSNARHVKEQICKSKALLLDMRHIVLYQSFDYDIREKIMMRTDAIVNYINSYMNAINITKLKMPTQEYAAAYA
ncbi:MAG: hypothetical protein V4482_06700 [Pseudomonadota bacterium]